MTILSIAFRKIQFDIISSLLLTLHVFSLYTNYLQDRVTLQTKEKNLKNVGYFLNRIVS